MDLKTRSFTQIIADHRAILGQILDQPVIGDVTPARFVELVEDAAFFTGRLLGSYMEAAAEDLSDIAADLDKAVGLADGSPEQQALLNAAHDRLRQLDPNEFLY